MIHEKMTVHKALAELKTLDSRINSEISGSIFVKANRHNNTKIFGKSVEDFRADTTASLQSVTALINRRNALKRAVVLSNAVTKVEIGGVQYSVAEAIEMNNHGMENLIDLRDFLRDQYSSAKRMVESKNGDKLVRAGDKLVRACEAYIQATFGSKDKVNNPDIETAQKAYMTNNAYDIVTGFDIEKVIKELTDKIDAFKSEVDSALSVSNALTVIEFDY